MFTKYNAEWGSDYKGEDLRIEMKCIQKGGAWTNAKGQKCGMGNIHHYEQMRKILWPNLDDHRWNRLCRDTILTSKITVLLGCASSGKTHSAAWIYLCEYFCFPDETCVLVSSTHMDGLKLRVWAEICMLWQAAIERFPYLPGHMVDSRILIATDDIKETDVDDRSLARDWRKGIKGVPCVQNGKFVGLAKFQGIKQKRMRLIADEASAMSGAFLSAFANLDKNEDFRAIILGNPNDVSDSLGKAAEPKDGWASHLEPTKTEVWETRFMNGRCVNLVGTDSPNFDFPADQPTRYKYLISKEKIENTLSFFPKDSVEYYSNCIGVMKVGILARRVVSRDMCVQFEAQKEAIWDGSPRTRIAALDAAYSGDRCALMHFDFGRDHNGETIFCCYPPVIVPVIVRQDMIAEDQIAIYVKQYAAENDIKPENFITTQQVGGHSVRHLQEYGQIFAIPWNSAVRRLNDPYLLTFILTTPKQDSADTSVATNITRNLSAN